MESANDVQGTFSVFHRGRFYDLARVGGDLVVVGSGAACRNCQESIIQALSDYDRTDLYSSMLPWELNETGCSGLPF